MHRVAVTCARISRASIHAASGLANIDITSINSKPSYDLSTTVLYNSTRFAGNNSRVTSDIKYSCHCHD